MMPELPSHAVGRWGLRVPAVGFGTAPLAVAPGWKGGEPISDLQAFQALEYAFNSGIRYFDTAPAYGCGLAEHRTGRFLSHIPRDEFVLATKVGFLIQDGELRRDYSRDGVLRSLESSLQRLNLSQIDILHVHDADMYARQVLEETFPALADLRSQGIIKAIGVGMNQWQVPLQFAENADFDCFMIAGRYTLLEQGALPLFDQCDRQGIAILAASIYNSGILALGSENVNATYNHAAPEASILDRVRAIEALCAECDISLHTLATRFPFGHPAVKSIVVGFQHSTEVRACLNALQQYIPARLWVRLREAGLLDFRVPVPVSKAIPK